MSEEKKMRRPNIPRAVQRELWIKSGGRCEFRGCNKYLYKDGVTQQPRNLANIAHIVSWIPTGPRGNENSERLATDISNLMLTCSEHNNLIDDSQYVDMYPVELLQKFKREHEDRILRVTGMGQAYGVRIIKMWSKIQNQVPQIGNQDIYDAVEPYYPLEETLNIDLTQVEDITTAMTTIERVVNLHLLSEQKQEKYCLFCMAKIPYSCYLGYVLGNKVKVDCFQYFRDRQNWKWSGEEQPGFRVINPQEEEKTQEVNVLVEVSGFIDKTLLPDNPCYHIQAETPGFLFLQSKRQVIEFQIKFRDLLSNIRMHYGEDVTVNLIPAIPNPIAFEIGRTIMKNIDPTVILYDKVENGIEYKPVMTLHKRVRQ